MIAMAKFYDWENRLVNYLFREYNRPMFWGKNDCCMFAAGAIEAMTGTDPAHWFRGRYNSRDEAFAKLKEYSGRGLYRTVANTMKDIGAMETETPQFGDIACIRTQQIDPEAAELSGGVMVAVIGNDGSAIAPGEKQFVCTQDYEVLKAWTV